MNEKELTDTEKNALESLLCDLKSTSLQDFRKNYYKFRILLSYYSRKGRDIIYYQDKFNLVVNMKKDTVEDYCCILKPGKESFKEYLGRREWFETNLSRANKGSIAERALVPVS